MDTKHYIDQHIVLYLTPTNVVCVTLLLTLINCFSNPVMRAAEISYKILKHAMAYLILKYNLVHMLLGWSPIQLKDNDSVILTATIYLYLITTIVDEFCDCVLYIKKMFGGMLLEKLFGLPCLLNHLPSDTHRHQGLHPPVNSQLSSILAKTQ